MRGFKRLDMADPQFEIRVCRCCLGAVDDNGGSHEFFGRDRVNGIIG